MTTGVILIFLEKQSGVAKVISKATTRYKKYQLHRQQIRCHYLLIQSSFALISCCQKGKKKKNNKEHKEDHYRPLKRQHKKRLTSRINPRSVNGWRIFPKTANSNPYKSTLDLEVYPGFFPLSHVLREYTSEVFLDTFCV